MLSGNGGEAFNCLYKYGYQMTRTVVNKYLTELYCVYAKEREEKRKHIVIWVPFRTKLMLMHMSTNSESKVGASE